MFAREPYNLSQDTIILLINKEDKEVSERMAMKSQKETNVIKDQMAVFNKGADFWIKMLELGKSQHVITPYEEELIGKIIDSINKGKLIQNRQDMKDINVLVKKLDENGIIQDTD